MKLISQMSPGPSVLFSYATCSQFCHIPSDSLCSMALQCLILLLWSLWLFFLSPFNQTHAPNAGFFYCIFFFIHYMHSIIYIFLFEAINTRVPSVVFLLCASDKILLPLDNCSIFPYLRRELCFQRYLMVYRKKTEAIMGPPSLVCQGCVTSNTSSS